MSLTTISQSPGIVSSVNIARLVLAREILITVTSKEYNLRLHTERTAFEGATYEAWVLLLKVLSTNENLAIRVAASHLQGGDQRPQKALDIITTMTTSTPINKQA